MTKAGSATIGALGGRRIVVMGAGAGTQRVAANSGPLRDLTANTSSRRPSDSGTQSQSKHSRGSLVGSQRLRSQVPAAVIPAAAAVIASHIDEAPRSPAFDLKNFKFDRVFPADADQVEVYKDVEPLIQSSLQGYHASVLTYGQTGSGKTHTMMGKLHSVLPRKRNKE